MKITIEWDSSHKAKVTIAGRELAVMLRPGVMSLEGVRGPETENTLAGIIATALYSKIGDCMQGWAIALEEVEPDAGWEWRELPDRVAQEVYDRVN